jgi:hypothetical protein
MCQKVESLPLQGIPSARTSLLIAGMGRRARGIFTRFGEPTPVMKLRIERVEIYGLRLCNDV